MQTIKAILPLSASFADLFKIEDELRRARPSGSRNRIITLGLIDASR
jgi:hypothetical protein